MYLCLIWNPYIIDKQTTITHVFKSIEKSLYWLDLWFFGYQYKDEIFYIEGLPW